MKKRFIFPIFAVLFVLGFSFALSFNTSPNLDNIGDTITYNSNVCTQVTRADGTVEPAECSSNLLYDSGKALIKVAMGNEATADAVDWIELCNATAGCGNPQADAGETYTAFTSCGLSKTAGTYTSVSDGNWTNDYTFTATCDDLVTNVTRLLNGASGKFAGNSFTIVTLQTDDTIKINWSLSVT